MTVPQVANNAEEAALVEFANELAEVLGVSKQEKATESIISKIRWYPRGNPPAVVVVARGANRKVLATISPTSGKWAHLYPSWKPVLAELARQKEAENVARLSHDGISTGSIPELATDGKDEK